MNNEALTLTTWEEDMTTETISLDESWKTRSRSQSPFSELPLEVQLGTPRAEPDNKTKTKDSSEPIVEPAMAMDEDDNSSPYTCELCDRSFPNIIGLKTHVRSHKRKTEKSSEIPPNKVPIAREQRNRRDTRLKTPIPSREREILLKPQPERHSCGQCIEAYSYASDLFAHVTQIHGPHFEARHASTEKQNGRIAAVETYWRDGMFYVCKFCGKSYLHIVGFRSHWRRHQREHPVTVTETKTLQMNISIPVPNSTNETFSAAVTLPLVDLIE